MDSYTNETIKKNRKRLRNTIIFVIIIVVLKTAIPKLLETVDSGRHTVPFDQMVYERPDIEAILNKFDSVISTVENSVKYDEQLKAIKSLEDDYENYYTMSSLANVKYDIDTTDQYYKNEVEFFSENSPKLQQKNEKYIIACSDSVYAEELEKEYFGENFFDDYEDDKVYTDEYVALLQKENELIDKYRAISASPVIEYEGKEKALSEVLKKDLSDEEYWAVIDQYYTKYNKILGDLYIDLIKVRYSIAKTRGYDSYIEYAYSEVYDRDYTPEQADKFSEDIRAYMVPLYQKLNDDELYYSDTEIPTLSETELLDITKITSEKMSSKIKNIYYFMQENKLYDVTDSDKKADTIYETSLYSYDAPFIFMKPVGDLTDSLSFSHEFGHFVDSFMNHNYSAETVEKAETASQTMEFLFANYLSGCSKSEIDFVRDRCFLESIDIFIFQGYYNEFEEKVYSLDEDDLTIARINRISGECASKFGLVDSLYLRNCWVGISHFFECPFYIIGYCVSEDTALQIYKTEKEQPGTGVDLYLKLTDSVEYTTYLEGLKQFNIDSPFDEGSVKNAAKTIEDYFYETSETSDASDASDTSDSSDTSDKGN